MISFSSLILGINTSPRNSSIGARPFARVSAKALKSKNPDIIAAIPSNDIPVSPRPLNASFKLSSILPCCS